MVGVLAALALVGYRKYLSSAQSSEAVAMIQGIRAAEEAYKAERLVYLGCTGCGGNDCATNVPSGNLTNYYPATSPTSKKYNFHNPSHADYACWERLNVTTDGPVRFGYAVVAGDPGVQPPSPGLAKNPTWPNPTTEPWYVIKAAGNRDGDSVFAYFLATSFSGEVYSENETE